MKIPNIKKEISFFLSSEEAKVLRKDVAKIGLTAGIISSIIAQASNAQAWHNDAHADHSSHSDTHSDTATHIDSHTDASGHIDHNNGVNDPFGTHTSVAAVYDGANRRGGHNSGLSHRNTVVHSDA